jgi:hypothetical protein
MVQNHEQSEQFAKHCGMQLTVLAACAPAGDDVAAVRQAGVLGGAGGRCRRPALYGGRRLHTRARGIVIGDERGRRRQKMGSGSLLGSPDMTLHQLRGITVGVKRVKHVGYHSAADVSWLPWPLHVDSAIVHLGWLSVPTCCFLCPSSDFLSPSRKAGDTFKRHIHTWCCKRKWCVQFAMLRSIWREIYEVANLTP